MSTTLLMATTIAGGLPQAAAASAAPEEAQAAQQQDPVQPIAPSGFERRDVEELDRQAEERRQRWRDEEAAKARAKKQREAASKG